MSQQKRIEKKKNVRTSEYGNDIKKATIDNIVKEELLGQCRGRTKEEERERGRDWRSQHGAAQTEFTPHIIRLHQCVCGKMTLLWILCG